MQPPRSYVEILDAEDQAERVTILLISLVPPATEPASESWGGPPDCGRRLVGLSRLPQDLVLRAKSESSRASHGLPTGRAGYHPGLLPASGAASEADDGNVVLEFVYRQLVQRPVVSAGK
jgi:hypothetical protein